MKKNNLFQLKEANDLASKFLSNYYSCIDSRKPTINKNTNALLKILQKKQVLSWSFIQDDLIMWFKKLSLVRTPPAIEPSKNHKKIGREMAIKWLYESLSVLYGGRLKLYRFNLVTSNFYSYKRV